MKSEKTIVGSKEKSRTIINPSPDFIYITDIEGNYLDANQATLDKAGLSLEELRSMNYKDFILKDNVDELIEAYKLLVNGQEIIRTEVQARMPSGEILYFEINAVPVKKNGNMFKILNIAKDITERKRVELNLKESEEKYREAYSRLNFYKDLFSHDINNILQNILSSAELSTIFLDNKEKQDKVSEALETIIDQVKKGSRLISKMRELSKIEEAPLKIQRIEVQNRIKKIIDFIKNTYQEKKIEIRIESPTKRNYIQANNLLEDAFENIIINAIKHNYNPTIEIIIKFNKLQENGKNCLKLEFRDNGRGIPDNKKEIIFQPGYKLQKSTKGMGIGLSLVKKIIESYNGKIWVEDRVKGDYTKGSNFILLIPISRNLNNI